MTCEKALLRWTAAVLVSTALLLSGANHGDARTHTKASMPGPDEVKAIAEEGYVYGLPLVMNYAAMYDMTLNRDSAQFKAPFNQIASEARVFTSEDTAIIVPNSDTPYSMLFMDLRAEPLVLSVPAVEEGRYYSVQLVDGNTFNYGYIGTRATGNDPGDYLVVGPGWEGEKPAGVRQVFRSSTQFALAIYRTQLLRPDDMPNVKKVQSGYKVKPLSAYLERPAPPPAPAVDFPKIDKDLVRTNFFGYLDFVLQFAPPDPEETAVRAKLARIGVGPGKNLGLGDLSPEQRAAVGRGMKDAARKVEEAAGRIGRDVNGWKIGSAFGDRAFYDGDWLKRAAAAKAGLYGNDAAEAVYPMTRNDSDGQPLDGSQHAYTLTFTAGQLPPARAFWSLTVYDGKTQLLVRNPIGRYLINASMLPSLTKAPDGSLTLYIRKDSPGKDKEGNWLPAPNGPIYLVMRLYWPRTEPPSILPPGEGTWQPPAVRRVPDGPPPTS